MRETSEELVWLQRLLDESFERAGPWLKTIIGPERRLNARQTAAYLQGVKHIAVATVTADGRPRVSPVDAVFLHGRFTFGTEATAMRARHIERNPEVSATHFVGDEVAITVHGRAVVLEKGTAEAAEVEAAWTELYGSSPYGWGKAVVMYTIEPTTMITYAPRGGEFPEA